MEMVKLKMRTRYKSILSFIGILIFLISLIGIIYLFYDKVVEFDSDIEANGVLSINYIDGKKINVLETDTIEISITNSSNKVVYYNLGFLKVRGNGTYKIKCEDAIVTEGKLNSTDEIITDNISIDGGVTKLYSIEIINENDTNLTATLTIRNYEGKSKTFADVLLGDADYSENSLTKPGNETAIEDEGLIKSYDDTGVSYYYRGSVTNNYVSFAGLTWRIVRINGDGTIRIVLDGITDGLVKYFSEDNNDYTYDASLAKVYLDDWYNIYLKEYSKYIANTKYCSDVSYDDTYTFNSYTRIMTNKIPSLNCLGTSFSSNIGMLTIDEVMLAGANSTEENTSYYLYNGNISDVWYTMSGAKGTDNSINMFMINSNGQVRTDISATLFRNIRPVINLVKNIEMSGSGTSLDPYRIEEE